jgi:hypothetical protein
MNDIVKLIFPGVKLNLETQESLLPVAFIGKGTVYSIVGMPFDSVNSKDAAAMAMKKIAKEMDADYILMVAESWTIPQEYVKDFMENRDKYPEVASHPHKKECVMFNYESHQECRMGMSDIITTAKGKRTINPPIFFPSVKGSSSTGRFTHLLPLRGM